MHSGLMEGFIVIPVVFGALLLLVVAAKWRRRHRHYFAYYGWSGERHGHRHDHGHAHWHGDMQAPGHVGPGHRPRGFRHKKRMLYMALAKLEATPAQERAIVAEVEKCVAKVRLTRGTWPEARDSLAKAIEGTSIDEEAFVGAFGHIDAARNVAQTATSEMIRNIHGMLDDKQRATLAKMLHRWYS